MPDTKQVNLRVDSQILASFDAVASAQGISRTEQMERLMNTYAEHHAERFHKHLDGSNCPLHDLLVGIQAAVIKEMHR